jgi:NAD+ synthase
VNIIEKAPSGGLYEGQTDEGEMGVTYAAIDSYLRGEEVSAHDRKIIEEHHKRSRHKRNMPLTLG